MAGRTNRREKQSIISADYTDSMYRFGTPAAEMNRQSTHDLFIYRDGEGL
jgi:hypothetical protein